VLILGDLEFALKLCISSGSGIPDRPDFWCPGKTPTATMGVWMEKTAQAEACATTKQNASGALALDG